MRKTIEKQGWVEGHPLLTKDTVIAESDSRENVRYSLSQTSSRAVYAPQNSDMSTKQYPKFRPKPPNHTSDSYLKTPPHAASWLITITC
jgi:hypothetical protein